MVQNYFPLYGNIHFIRYFIMFLVKILSFRASETVHSTLYHRFGCKTYYFYFVGIYILFVCMNNLYDIKNGNTTRLWKSIREILSIQISQTCYPLNPHKTRQSLMIKKRNTTIRKYTLRYIIIKNVF